MEGRAGEDRELECSRGMKREAEALREETRWGKGRDQRQKPVWKEFLLDSPRICQKLRASAVTSWILPVPLHPMFWNLQNWLCQVTARAPRGSDPVTPMHTVCVADEDLFITRTNRYYCGGGGGDMAD